jgi:hypothetical protein
MHSGQTRPGLGHKTNDYITAIDFSAGIHVWIGTWVGAWYLQWVRMDWNFGRSKGWNLGSRWVISNGLELGVSLGFPDGLELGSEQGLEPGVQAGYLQWIELEVLLSRIDSCWASPMEWNSGCRRWDLRMEWSLGSCWASLTDWNLLGSC